MQWTISLNNAPRRVNHSAVAIDDRIYSFGGYTSCESLPNNIDVHAFDSATLMWWQVHYPDEGNAPNGLYGHSVVAHGRKIYVWGGQNGLGGLPTSDLYCFDIDELRWSMPGTSGQVPSAADGHSACVIGDYMYVFGGFEQYNQRFAEDIHRINLVSYHWELLMTEGNPPDSRDFHTATAIGDRMYLFGGRSCTIGNEAEEEYYTNQMMYLDTKTMTWMTPPCVGCLPCGRRSHTASVYENQIYIIGGYEGRTDSHLNDVYKFNPASNAWTKFDVRGTGPSPRRRHCACVIRDQLYLFGGSSPNDRSEPMYLQLGFDLLETTEHNLVEHNDMHVLEFSVSLKRLAQLEILMNGWWYDLNVLPKSLRKEIESMVQKDSVDD